MKNITAKSKPVETDPFATAVDDAPAKKRITTKTAPSAKMAEAETKPVKKAVRKADKPAVSDPFAEIAGTTSPIKKRAAKKSVPEGAVAGPTINPGTSYVGDLIPKTPKTRKMVEKATLDATADNAALEPKVGLSPTFKALADVTLPELGRENRARLQMQTPTRLYFYWSIKENAWALLRNVFGADLGSYSLVLKLIDNKHGLEEIHQTDAEGNYWFDVEPDGSYQAEIGFYAPNRPYFRILHSNTVETPRRSPS
ncbi:MAG: DUF4912 domain-containing protein, partial [Pyrinomonadaceae bacterium]